MGDWIRQKYVELANSIRKGKCLKTDCWNEAEDFNPIRADVYLEIDQARCDKAKAKGYNVLQGDIMDMPFENEEFDCIFDCSTIDHVEDYNKALNEYKRCLKKDGKILIVVWVSNGETQIVDNDGWGSKQYWFNKEQFTKDFKELFTLKSDDKILIDSNKKLLWYYIGENK